MVFFKTLNEEKKSKDMLLLTSLTFLILSASLRGEECDKPCKCCKAGNCTNGQGKCQGCINGYTGDKCNIPCPTNCVNCSQMYFISENVCPACKDGFYNGRFQDHHKYSLQKNCALSCKQHCARCTSFSNCLKCEDGYFFTSDQECSACPINCKQCNDETTCINCMESYYWDGQARRCQHCNFRCKACVLYDICSKCEDGFFVEENECKACHEGCRSCESFDSCSSCNRGYYQLNDRCVTCKSHCSDCKYAAESSYTCNSCDNGYFLFNNTCYEPCGDGCVQCSTNTQCSSCEKEYFKLDGHCVKCPVKCLSCSSEENCTQCISGYHGHDCSLPCPGKCKECRMVSGTCISCNDGYYLENFKLCEKCPVHCVDCTSSSSCLVCKPGFMGPNCFEKCYNCREGTKCDKSTGYCQDDCRDGLSSTNCSVKCSANCLTCERQSAHKCKICASNWFGPECSSTCPLHCKSKTCVINGRCTFGCEDGYWGSHCDKNCSNLCERNVCDIDYGICTHGCVENYTDNNCVCFKNCICDSNDMCSGCKNGLFGNLCENECSVGCINRVCSKNTGICSAGCKGGFKGNMCTGDSTALEIETIAVLVLFLIVLVTVCCIIVCCIIRKRQTFDMSTNGHNTRVSTVCHAGRSAAFIRKRLPKGIRDLNRKTDDDDGDVTLPELEAFAIEACPTTFQEADAGNTPVDLKMKEVAVDRLDEYVKGKTAESFQIEFQELPFGLVKLYTESQKEKNYSMNRYQGIFPYDETRVVLHGGPTDYINASFIAGFYQRKAYIAAMGPTTRTMGDMSAFWRMVWQEHCGKIVMLTCLYEEGVIKCDKYWPDNGRSNYYGDINVTNQSEEKFQAYTIRIFIVKKDSEKRHVVHFQMTGWPDRQVPDTTSLLEFRQRINNTFTELDGPVIVHCSAGVGRTGTYIALDILTKEGDVTGVVNVFACVRKLREQRVKLVYNVEQYEFLHRALLATLSGEHLYNNLQGTLDAGQVWLPDIT